MTIKLCELEKESGAEEGGGEREIACRIKSADIK